jgi:hypothetical protein
MKMLISGAWLAAIYFYLSFHGIAINSREYWTIAGMITVSNVLTIWQAKGGK